MNVPCPNCSRIVEQHSPPIRGPANDGSELWLCMKCPAVVCSHPVFSAPEVSEPCYIKHTREAHPECYGLKKQPTGGGKKNKKGKRR